jgi:hypothetical protein
VQDWASVKAPRGNTWSSFVSDFDDTTYDLIDVIDDIIYTYLHISYLILAA